MPRRTRTSEAGQVQTLRQARRAYRRAGGVPILAPAQIRAAERAAQEGKRAAEAKAKEKRIRENRRKREEQEAEQKREIKRLVRLGKLPEDSLWAKVRSSQPRLYTFLDARHRNETGSLEIVSALEGRCSGISSQRSLEGNKKSSESTEGRLEAQTSISATQLTSIPFDDGSLKAERNRPTKTSCDPLHGPARAIETSLIVPNSKEPKDGAQSTAAVNSKEVARPSRTLVSPSRLNAGIQGREVDGADCAAFKKTLPFSCEEMKSIDLPSASQLEEFFGIYENEFYDDDQSKEDSHSIPSSFSSPQTSLRRGSMPALPPFRIARRETTPIKPSLPAFHKDQKIPPRKNSLFAGLEEEFDANIDEELLAEALDIHEPESMSHGGNLLEAGHAFQHLRCVPSAQKVESTAPASRGQNSRGRTEGKQYSFASLDDAELACLASVFDCIPPATINTGSQ